MGSQRVRRDLERYCKVANEGAPLVPSLYCVQLMTKPPGAHRRPTIICSKASFLSMPVDTNCSPGHLVNFPATSSQAIVSPVCLNLSLWEGSTPDVVSVSWLDPGWYIVSTISLHAPFLKKLLEDTVHKHQTENHKRERQHIKEADDPTKEKSQENFQDKA